MIGELPIHTMLIIWLFVVGGTVWLYWRNQQTGIGIVLAYLLLLGLEHWIPGVLYTFPFYFPLYDPYIIWLGIQQTLYAVIAFAFGVLIVGPLVWRIYQSRLRSDRVSIINTEALPKIYAIIGLVSYFILIPLFGRIPTVSSVVTNLANLFFVGIVLGWRQAGQAKKRQEQLFWLAAAMVWPLVTTTTQGFLGFGALTLIIILVFIARTSSRPIWLIIPALLIGYFSLSIFVTYMQHRPEIRDVTWDENSTLNERIEVVMGTATQFEWLDIYYYNHMYYIDLRLNQNFLAGNTVERITTNQVESAKGQTIGEAVLMLIPRAIWPDKPFAVGGQGLVNKYADFYLSSRSSAAPGQVMEFYLNYGTIGVVGGFVVMGTLLSVIDRMAAYHLQTGNWATFAVWYLPALSLLKPNDVLRALTSGSISGLITVLAVNFVLTHLILYNRRVRYRSMDIQLKDHRV